MLVDHGNDIAAQIPHLSSIASIPMSSPVFTGRYCLGLLGFTERFFYQPDFASGTEANGDHPHFIVSSGNDPSNG